MINQYGVLSTKHQQVIDDASKLLFTQIRLHMDDMELDQAAIFMLELQVCILGHLSTYKLQRATLKRKQAAQASKQTTERVCVQLLEEWTFIPDEYDYFMRLGRTTNFHDWGNIDKQLSYEEAEEMMAKWGHKSLADRYSAQVAWRGSKPADPGGVFSTIYLGKYKTGYGGGAIHTRGTLWLRYKQAAQASKQTTERVCVQLLEEGDLIMHENKVYKMTSRYHDAFQGTTTVYFYRTGLPTLGEPRRPFYTRLVMPNSRNCWVNKVKRNEGNTATKRYTHYKKKETRHE